MRKLMMALTAAIIFFPLALSAQQGTPERSPPIKESEGTAVKSPTPKDNATKKPAEQKTPAAKPTPQTLPVKNERPPEPDCGARCQAAQQREKDDLKAQQAMARYAEQLADLTFWQIVVAAIAVILLLCTLFFTYRATNAAVAAVKVTSDTTEHQLRAYIGVIDGHIDWNEGRPIANLTIKNTGQTPAYGLTNWINGCSGGRNEFGKEDGDDYFPRFDLLPGETVKMAHDPKTPLDYGDFERLRLFRYVWGRIEFTDAFNEPRWVTFRYRMGSRLEGHIFRINPTPEGNESN